MQISIGEENMEHLCMYLQNIQSVVCWLSWPHDRLGSTIMYLIAASTKILCSHKSNNNVVCIYTTVILTFSF